MRTHARIAALLILFAVGAVALGGITSPAVIGEVQRYRVMRGDTLALVAARFGLASSVLARDNELPANARLTPGQTLRIDNRHIVPAGMDEGIVINLPQRRLFLFRGGSVRESYPIAVGSGGWKTPVGEFSVRTMEVDPAWDVPKSIQAEMAREGKRVLTRVPPGPDNPLGTRWIGLTPSIGIHGTNAPTSIFRYSTHGCIRMATEDVEHLFEQIQVGDPVAIIYEPLLVARDRREVFVEVHGDPYGRGGVSLAALRGALAAIDAGNLASHPETTLVLKQREGRAVSLTEVVRASRGTD